MTAALSATFGFFCGVCSEHLEKPCLGTGEMAWQGKYLASKLWDLLLDR